MDFGVSVSAMTLLKDIVKYIKEKKDKDEVLLEMVANLREEIFTLNERLLEQMVKNQELEGKIRTLETAAEETASVRWDEHKGIWVDKENPGQGGYCPKCKSKRKELVPLTISFDGWKCRVCDEYYSASESKLGQAVADDYESLGRE